jgi:cytochrome P450
MTTSHAYPAAVSYGKLLDHANRHNPYPHFTELARAPVRQLDEHTWLVSRHADITALLRDARLSAQGPADPTAPAGSDGKPYRGAFVTQDPPHHDTLRAQTMHQFVPRILGMRPHIEDMVTRLLDQHSGEGPGEIDVVASLAYPLPVAVICALLGVPPEEEPVFHSFAGRLTRALDPIEALNEQEIADLELARPEWRAYLMPMIEQRRASPGTDLISALLTDGDPAIRMNTIELATTLGLLLIAGHETTVNLVANGTLALLRNPDVLHRLRVDPGLAPAVVEEVLRYDPPVQMIGRHTTADIRVADQVVPAGDRVVMLLAAGNRDPHRFLEPERFWPERSGNAHLSFGGGVHYCLGAALARMEAEAALTAIATRLDNPRLVADPPPYRPNMLLRGPEELRVAHDRITGGGGTPWRR